ncbi:MAG: glycoside hydrolase family 3 protein [Acidimicrobiales bacterium]|nr:glycoside hydrolase family 3 protein [Acidimicrobiales bacterium]
MLDAQEVNASLSIAEKCALIAGETNWRTPAFPHAGVPQLKMTDGPSGVRGEQLGEQGSAGVSVPAGITLGASWDVDLLAEIGDLLGRECVRKSAHVLLGPTINLHRTPLGGRTFECYSEDPELTGALAARYVTAVQANQVAVTAKHFVGNDTEVDRVTVDVRIDERTLRELYLRPFEMAVRDGGAWGVMSAYNQVNGAYAAHNHHLLTQILRDEWGFDGMVVSDWFGLHDGPAGVAAGLSVEMPGPPIAYGPPLAEAVRAGVVPSQSIDRLVSDVITTINRTDAVNRIADTAETSIDDPDDRALTRRAAISGTVLLRNADLPGGGTVLPADGTKLQTVAVIGPNAAIDRSMGGGSASLRPFGSRSFLAALTDRLPRARVSHHVGAAIDRLTPLVQQGQLQSPTGEPGLRVEYFNGTDWSAPAEIVTSTPTSILRFFGSTPTGIDPLFFGVRATGFYVPAESGEHTFGVVSTGPIEVVVTPTSGPAQTVVDDPENLLPRSEEFFGLGSAESTITLNCVAGEPVAVSMKWRSADTKGFAALRLGVQPPQTTDLIAEAAAAAATADLAVLVVGTNDEWESEGFDRTTMDLPGPQADLIRAVVAANPNTAVIVNAGSPVAMDWADNEDPAAAPAVFTSFFAGQEQAEALVDVLLGEADPGGRLPLTYPKRLEDTPAFLHHQPDHDSAGRAVQRYGEGLFVGYRWYDARSIEPRFPFGHGLSYGEAVWGDPSVSGSDKDFTVSVPISSIGDRTVTVVVQGYVAPVEPRCIRPPKELKAWAKASLAPGDRTTLSLRFGPEAFRHWDTATSDWNVDPGPYDLVIASSATSEHARLRITVSR